MNGAMLSLVWGVGVALFGAIESAGGTATRSVTDPVVVHTPYAVVTLAHGSAAEITPKSPGSSEAVVRTANGSHIVGSFAEKFTLILAGKASPAAAYNSDAPWDPPLYFLFMANGDYVNGHARDGAIAVMARAGADVGSLRAMRGIEIREGAVEDARLAMAADGALEGVLRLEDIALVLEASPAIRVYDRRGDAGKGLAAGETVPMQVIRMGDSRMIGYCVDRRDGVRVRNVSSGAPAGRGGMKVGDWVLSIDGRPASPDYDIWTPRDAVTAGRQQHLLLETRRGAVARWYLIVR